MPTTLEVATSGFCRHECRDIERQLQALPKPVILCESLRLNSSVLLIKLDYQVLQSSKKLLAARENNIPCVSMSWMEAGGPLDAAAVAHDICWSLRGRQVCCSGLSEEDRKAVQMACARAGAVFVDDLRLSCAVLVIPVAVDHASEKMLFARSRQIPTLTIDRFLLCFHVTRHHSTVEPVHDTHSGPASLSVVAPPFPHDSPLQIQPGGAPVVKERTAHSRVCGSCARRPVVICFSAVPVHSQRVLTTALERSGLVGTVSSMLELDVPHRPDTTHLVIPPGAVLHSEKAAQLARKKAKGGARCCHVVSVDWLRESVAARRWLDSEPFAVQLPSLRDFRPPSPPGPDRPKKRRALEPPGAAACCTPAATSSTTGAQSLSCVSPTSASASPMHPFDNLLRSLESRALMLGEPKMQLSGLMGDSRHQQQNDQRDVIPATTHRALFRRGSGGPVGAGGTFATSAHMLHRTWESPVEASQVVSYIARVASRTPPGAVTVHCVDTPPL